MKYSLFSATNFSFTNNSNSEYLSVLSKNCLSSFIAFIKLYIDEQYILNTLSLSLIVSILYSLLSKSKYTFDNVLDDSTKSLILNILLNALFVYFKIYTLFLKQVINLLS